MDPLFERLEGLPKLEPPPEVDAELQRLMRRESEPRALPAPIALGRLEGATYVAVVAAYAVFVAKNAVLMLFG